jgi:hypothetical protein
LSGTTSIAVAALVILAGSWCTTSRSGQFSAPLMLIFDPPVVALQLAVVAAPDRAERRMALVRRMRAINEIKRLIVFCRRHQWFKSVCRERALDRLVGFRRHAFRLLVDKARAV